MIIVVNGNVGSSVGISVGSKVGTNVGNGVVIIVEDGLLVGLRVTGL